MEYESHDQHFKNLFLDFPKEALEWLAPEVLEEFGTVQQVEFVRQEPKKRKLPDAHLALDMPILFTFEQAQVLLWLVEFQEDKAKFSIYTLSHYTLEMLEAYPGALILPTVLFTDRTRWRKDVLRKLDNTFKGRVFLHFEYLFIKLFEYQAKDYYRIQNPVVKILLPKMHYAPEERVDVICHAYIGLFQIVSRMLFDKYTDFIDIYAQITKDEREALYHTLEEHKETVMLAQYIREKGKTQARFELLGRQLVKKYHLASEQVPNLLEGLASEDLLELGERIVDVNSFADIQRWIQQRKSHIAQS